jgi:hypothetical protein
MPSTARRIAASFITIMRPRRVYDPPEGCVVELAHDSAKAELTLTLVKKPWLLPEGLLWNGFSETLEGAAAERHKISAR